MKKEVREVDCKFYATFKDAKKDNNSFHHVVEVEGIFYPTLVVINGIKYHPRVIKRSIPIEPFSIEEKVYVKGDN
jgi:YbbR domain-containing protein